MTTVGYGDISMKTNAERVYAICAMIAGGAFYGYIIGSVSTMIADRDQAHRAFVERMQTVVNWLEVHGELPKSLRRRVWKHFKEFLTLRDTVSDSLILNDLPPNLSQDVAFYILDDTIRYNPLFEDLPTECLSAVVAILQELRLASEEVVVEAGAPGAMFVVSHGHVEVRDAKKTMMLCHGDSFGEENLLGHCTEMMCTAEAKSVVLLYKIDRESFLAQFSSKPRLLQQMKKNFLKSSNHRVVAARASDGKASLLLGGQGGVPPTFPDAVMQALSKIDHLLDMQTRLDELNKKIDIIPHSLAQQAVLRRAIEGSIPNQSRSAGREPLLVPLSYTDASPTTASV